jgi:hypothetical protein
MKKLILLITVILAGMVTYAQDSNTMYLKTDTSAKVNMKDYVVMRNGVMMVYKGGDSVAMTSVMTLKDSSTVKQDGTITRKNGDSMKLKEGEGVYMNGKPRMKNDMMVKKDSASN